MKNQNRSLIGIIILAVIVIIVLSTLAEEEKPLTESNESQIPLESQAEFTGNWIKYSTNPVLKEQPSSNWFQWSGDPFVLKDGEMYKMWFGANKKDSITNIGYATSSDGINWNLHPKPVLKIGEEGEWDDFSVETPSVIKNSDGTYEMWYSGAGGAPEDEDAGWDRLHKIGYATSSDGINWNKHSNQVFDIDLENYDRWDFAGKADPSVIKENGIYKMWYTGAGVDGELMITQTGYATSSDGINWKRRRNPILAIDNQGNWDGGSVSAPSVFFNGENYIMLYTGNAIAGETEQGVATGSIGCATSDDGINWNRLSGPCLTKGNGRDFDDSGLWGATGLYDGKEYKAWYTGLKISGDIHVSIGYAFIE